MSEVTVRDGDWQKGSREAAERLIACGMEATKAKAFAKYSRPGVALVPDALLARSAQDQDAAPHYGDGSFDVTVGMGAAQIGGVPRVPDDFLWPARGARTHQGAATRLLRPGQLPAGAIHMAFVAQVDLAAVSRVLPEAENLLPDAGSLAFFYDALDMPGGHWSDDGDDFAVLYFPPGTALRPAVPPEDLLPECSFSPVVLRPERVITLPGVEEIGDLMGNPAPGLPRMDEAETEAYYSALEDGYTEGASHQLLGHPDAVQHPTMGPMCQLASNGVDVFGYPPPSRERVDEVTKDADSWRLLLQVDSDDAASMMWGDAGMLYFWIRDEDLAARRFDRVWCIMQGY